MWSVVVVLFVVFLLTNSICFFCIYATLQLTVKPLITQVICVPNIYTGNKSTTVLSGFSLNFSKNLKNYFKCSGFDPRLPGSTENWRFAMEAQVYLVSPSLFVTWRRVNISKSLVNSSVNRLNHIRFRQPLQPYFLSPLHLVWYCSNPGLVSAWKSQLLMEWNGGIELICITLVITLWPQRPSIPSNYMFVYFMHHFDTETWVQISTKHAISYDGTFFHEYIPQECIPVGCVQSAAVAVWLVDRILDTRLWKHYLSATTVADGKDISKHCISRALHPSDRSVQ